MEYNGGQFDAEVNYRYNRSREFDQPPDQYYDGPAVDNQDQATYSEYASIPDVLQLNLLCANAKVAADSSPEARHDAEESWEPVREWLRSHNADEVRQAAEHKGDSSMTALHFASRNQPPIDVVNVFLSIAAETVQWPDTFGWLPIHYACACGAAPEVLTALAEAFPESKTSVDRRGRTPLHFALGNGNQNPDKLAAPAVVAILSSSGAAAYPDDNGMLPLHYACAYGASQEALYVLTGAYRPAIGTRDRNNRTPLHFALSNAGRPASPGAVRHLLELDPRLANSNGGPLPLRVLAEFSHTLHRDGDVENYESVQRCLEHLLRADPDPTADFFTALQSLPEWLQERAVVLPSVQILLNEKISQRFPTMVLMGDFYFLVIVIIAYSINVKISIDKRVDPNDANAINIRNLSALYFGAGYFLFREVVQLISLISLKSFHIWVYDASNWLNILFIILVVYWTLLMQSGGGEDLVFRYGTALSVTVLYLKVMSFLRNLFIDFAVFVGGVFYVFRRLVAFLTALMIILIGFSQMFVTIYQQTEWCIPYENGTIAKTECPIDPEKDTRAYCSHWSAFLNVYTMLLGEVDETVFQSDPAVQGVATFFFIVFMFLVVILLANVLIAIVTDSYKVIQDQRAAIVFWTNRLDFVAEMDAIANGPWKQRIRKFFSAKSQAENTGHVDVSFGKEFWKRLMDLFDDEIDDDIMSVEFWAINLLRIATALLIIPAWICLGLLSAGWLWPPQLRELIFTSTVSKHSSESEREDELRKTQVTMLQKEVKELEEDMTQELKVDRTAVVQMKSAVAERRAEIVAEMKHIKRIMTMLFDQQAAM